MALAPNRGQPPGEGAQVTPGKPVELFFGFSNGKAAAKDGMLFRGRLQTTIRPLSWSLITDDVASSLTVDVRVKPHGSGSFTSIVSTEVPTLSAAIEDDDLITLWPDLLAGEWVEGKLGAITSGSPKFVGLTIFGERI